jgi:hypothetical protein
MFRKLKWNPQHHSQDEQQNKFIDDYLTWSTNEKWDYLMEIISLGLPEPIKKGTRKIEWK